MIADNHTLEEKKLMRQTILEIKCDINDFRLEQGDMDLHKVLYDKINKCINEHLKNLE